MTKDAPSAIGGDAGPASPASPTPGTPPIASTGPAAARPASESGSGVGDGAAAPYDLMGAWGAMMTAWDPVLRPMADALAAIRAASAPTDAKPDRRVADPSWNAPLFAILRDAHALMTRAIDEAVAAVPLTDPTQRDRMRFAARTLAEMTHPANAPLTNPVALAKAMETGGQSLIAGLSNLAADVARGQLTHTSPDTFVLGETIAATPGAVVHETPLYQLIQYSPTTASVQTIPLIIFPPWINRFYILDLTAEKSFIRWCVDLGLTVFMVSWKSADETMGDVVWDDYIAAQIDAIDTVRGALDVPSVHSIGYCVAGTTLAATLAILAATDRASHVASATFFTAQVDFSNAGELLHFVDDAQLAMIDALSHRGYLDGRYMALTFNLLRGQDLIWSTVGKHYLLGQDYPAFDLLHWNGDVTNLPARWHRSYLTDLYRDNRLATPGGMTALGVPIDLSLIRTPAYIQAGREDHIAPAASVFKLRDHLSGPTRFVLAGSGHIAGVVNPPMQAKYQYWRNDDPAVDTLDAFVAGATETKGSWWPDWHGWLTGHDPSTVPATGARVPGKGRLPAIEPAPGRYVTMR